MSFYSLQKDGSTILSMDALFGLPRKKSAGVSHRKPLFGNLFFHDQSEVDLFVSEYTCSKQGSNVSLHLVKNV